MRRLTAFLAVLLSVSMGGDVAVAVEATTVAEAAERLDLVTLPLMPGGELTRRRHDASLRYSTAAPTGEAFEFVDKQLTDRGWEQAPDAQRFDDQGFANASYTRDGYLVYLSVIPDATGQRRVSLTHKGNVALTEAPKPEILKAWHSFPHVATYKSGLGVAETAKACREALLADGWEPYGGVGNPDRPDDYFRKNGVKLSVGTSSAPAQQGATVVTYGAALLSLELPAPPFAEGFRYDDGTSRISFDCDKTAQEIADFYRQVLKPLGWKATTAEPVEIRWRDVTVFRNGDQEMITLSSHQFEGKTRTRLDHQDVAEVADEELRMRVSAGEKAKYREVTWQKVTLPSVSSPVDRLKRWAVKTPSKPGKAFVTAERIGESLAAAGWRRSGEPNAKPFFRSQRLEQGERSLWLLAVEPPRRAAWVAVVGVGGIELSFEE